MKKVYFNIFFQLVALTLIIKTFFFDELEYNKISLLQIDNLILLVIFSIIIKLSITYLFYSIINIISPNKINYLDITSVHLQGGLINQILPGVGHIFRYYKLKLYSNITLSRYSITQIIWSLNSLFVYFFSAAILGFLAITSYGNLYFFITLIIITVILVLKFRYKFYEFINKIYLKYDKKLHFINDLKKLKKLLFRNRKKFFFIFNGFIMLIIFQCFVFYVSLSFFGIEVSLLSSFYIFITAALLTTLALINFFGFFEIIITLSAAIFVPEIEDMLIFAINLRIINLFSLILCIINISILKRIIK
jgi:hypothetical protein